MADEPSEMLNHSFSDRLGEGLHRLRTELDKTSSKMDSYLRKKLLQAGPEFKPTVFLKKIALPLFVGGFLLAAILKFLIFRLVPILDGGFLHYLPYIIPVLSIALIFFLPRAHIEARKNDMDSKISLYITYLGTLSTSNPTRKMLFYMASQKEEYGELAKESRNILKLADSWGLGYARACRIVSQTSPSRIFADFLERFAHSFQAGEDTTEFLRKEQKVVMDVYTNYYKAGLYGVEGMKSMYTSLSTTLSFIVVFALLLPFITGQSVNMLIGMVALAFLFIDGITLYMIKTVLPSDDLIHDIKVRTKNMEALDHYLPFVVTATLLLFIIILILNWFSMPYVIAISLTPLGVYGYIAGRGEENIRRSDSNFAAFLRTLGGAAGARSGMISSVLGSLKRHEYGPLTRHINNLHRRLELGDSFKAWRLFAGEIGSDMILKFSMIFRESVHIGGNPAMVSEIVSTNFERIHSLRGERKLMASSMKATLYGSGIGVALSVYVAMGILSFLNQNLGNFTGIEQILPGIGNVSGVNTDLITSMIWVLLVLHSGLAAMTIKVTDGGDMTHALFHFAVMIWVSAIIATMLPSVFSNMFGAQVGGAGMIESLA